MMWYGGVASSAFVPNQRLFNLLSTAFTDHFTSLEPFAFTRKYFKTLFDLAVSTLY